MNLAMLDENFRQWLERPGMKALLATIEVAGGIPASQVSQLLEMAFIAGGSVGVGLAHHQWTQSVEKAFAIKEARPS